MRVGIYADLVFWVDGATVSTDRSFIRFVASLPPRVDEIVLFGRVHPERRRAPDVVPAKDVRLVPLPYYPSVDAVGSLLRASPSSVRRFAAELHNLDLVWIFGPHPLALPFALVARHHALPVVLGVRQDYPAYIASRLPERRGAVATARALDAMFRALSRRCPTVTVGTALARRYGGGDAPVLATGLSLIREAEIVEPQAALAKPWNDEIRLINVGRFDREKNPLLLLDVLAELRRRNPAWRLAVAGDGPLLPAFEERARALGVVEHLELLGYVANGPELWEHYRRSHAFLHVSFTEGLPQVVFEAQAAGLPIVATDVGGIGDALQEGAVLVPPGDAAAAVSALERLRDDAVFRRRLVELGLTNVRKETMEAQLDRVGAFLRAAPCWRAQHS